MRKLCRYHSKLTLFILWSVITFTGHAEPIATADEPKLRAAIVLGIIRYSNWPDDTKMAGQLNVCSLGSPPSEQILTQVSGQHRYHDLSIITHAIKDPSSSPFTCHALILGAQLDASTLQHWFATHDRHGLLTICDGCVLNTNPAMVTLVRRDNRIAFHVNLTQAKSADITFRSALLELALGVRNGQ